MANIDQRRRLVDDIIDAFLASGKDTLRLKELYELIAERHTVKLSGTWQADVRKTLQCHAKSHKSYRGIADIFSDVKWGVWKISETLPEGYPRKTIPREAYINE